MYHLQKKKKQKNRIYRYFFPSILFFLSKIIELILESNNKSMENYYKGINNLFSLREKEMDQNMLLQLEKEMNDKDRENKQWLLRIACIIAIVIIILVVAFRFH